MKRINLILAVSCLFLLSCEVDSIETQEEANTNLVIELNKSQNATILPTVNGPGGATGPPSSSCTPFDVAFEHRLTWTAYISGLAVFGDGTIISELQTQLNLNQTTKALRLNDLLASNTATPFFKQEFERLASDIMNEVTTVPAVGGCPDTPAGGPDDPTGGDICSSCDPYQVFMNDILVNNCIELYFPRGVYSDLTVDITTVAHPLCNSYSNDGYTRENCGTAVETLHIFPNMVQTQSRTYIVARPVVDLSNSNCTYSAYVNIDLNYYLSGTWPLAN